MQIKPHAPKADDFDLKELKAMIESRPFGRVRDRIAAELERQRAACERGAKPLDIYRAQGAIAALKTVLGLPEQVYREISAELAQTRAARPKR